MPRVKIEFETVTIIVIPRETETAKAIMDAAPFSSTAQTWGDEVYFDTPVTAPNEPDAKDVLTLGELAFWLAGGCIAIGYGPTPVSRGHEIRLASPANIWGDAVTDLREAAAVDAGSTVHVTLAED